MEAHSPLLQLRTHMFNISKVSPASELHGLNFHLPSAGVSSVGTQSLAFGKVSVKFDATSQHFLPSTHYLQLAMSIVIQLNPLLQRCFSTIKLMEFFMPRAQ
ncbi:Hypothetical protein NTJ_05053 [Nesidiocoris tenuis]|uniref:Uncharacterized protein n=1 Tax=Nesidiocoris tenuis TaxID=355587 RepID=A0ABN7AJ17_9HEMI|nr:Hypothetical protein NTJ_05053 [Nesidiocoris tenuis]